MAVTCTSPRVLFDGAESGPGSRVAREKSRAALGGDSLLLVWLLESSRGALRRGCRAAPLLAVPCASARVLLSGADGGPCSRVARLKSREEQLLPTGSGLLLN